MRRGRSMSTSKLAVTRPGRGDMTTMRSPRRAASRTLWVTNSTVAAASGRALSSSSWSVSRVIASRAPNGSSISRTSASWASARASAPRWRMPPDSWCGRFLAKPPRCTVSISSRRPLPALGLADAGQPHRQLDVGLHGEPREQRRLLEHQRRRRRRRRRVPELGSSSPATRLRIVDLPQPDAPIRQTNSPASTSRSTPASAVTARGPVPNVLDDAAERDRRSQPRRLPARRCAFEHLVEQRQVVDAGRLQVDGVEQADGLGVVGRRLQRRGDRVEREARGSSKAPVIVASASGLPVSSPMPALTSVWALAGSAVDLVDRRRRGPR